MPATGNQTHPAVASDGTSFLVVWEDDRSGTADIYGARVTASGVIDPNGFAIDGGGAYGRRLPSVASNGSEYYVAWRLDTPGPGPDIYGVRVGEDSSVVDAPANLSAAVASGAFAIGTDSTVASDGSGFVIAWGNHGDGSQLAARAVDATGTPGAGIVLCTSGAGGLPAIAFGASEYVIAYVAGALAGVRMSPAIAELGCFQIAASPICGARCGAIAFDGTQFVSAWEDGLSPGIVASRIDGAGTVLDSPPPLLAAGSGVSQPAVGSAPSGRSLVAWSDAVAGIRSRAIASDGTLDATPATLASIGAMTDAPAAAFGGGRFLVVAETATASTGEEIEGWFVATDNTASAPFVISGGGCGP